MSFWSKIASVTLVVLIGATASILLVLSQGDRLREEVAQYPIGSTAISLYGVSEEHSAVVLSVLDRFAHAAGHAVVRVDPQSSPVDGGLSGMRIGMAASSRTPPSALELKFLGTALLDSGTISKLLAGGPATSVGLDANAADVVAAMPELALAPRLSVVHLAHLIDTSGTINGTYRIVSADPADVTELLQSLSTATGHSAESMLAPLHGQSTDNGLLPSILLGCLIAASLLLLLVLVFEALRSFPVLGVHLLLGRSTWGFGARMFLPVLVAAGATVVLSTALIVVLARGYEVNGALLWAAASGAVAGAVPVIGGVALAVVVVASTKPVNAILGRYSKKALLWAIASFYVVGVAGFAFLLVYIDGPIKEAGKLAEVSKSWSTVADQQILYQLSAGDDGASFTGQSSRLAKDFYDWYSSIADKPGVSLANAVHYDQPTLSRWSGIYTSVPEQPFWYMTASPSALAAQGFHVSDDVLDRARRGERVFLLPDAWAPTTTRAMEGWLAADSHRATDPSIRTRYFDAQTVGFGEYSPQVPLFSWTADPSLPPTVTDPVILVATPENMIPFESESLFAHGLANSYVKLSAGAASEYTADAYLAKFHLDDNQVEFLPASEFIAGLTKTIQSTLQLFGGVILFLFLLLTVALVALTRLFTTTYRESLAVKRMLGYTLPRLFAAAIVVIGATGILAVGAAVLLQSKSAIAGTIILLVIQLALIVFLIRRYSRLQLSAALKE